MRLLFMRIDKDKPLPDHTKLDYDECCALLILKELFPDRYSVLEISDKPDLQGLDIGVEVTIADDRKHQEALNNWVKANNCDNEKKREYYIERMKQLGVTYTGGIQSWPEQAPSLKHVKEAVNTKLEKVRLGKYKYFLNYELFIFTDTWMHETIKEVEAFFADTNVFDCFNRIYVLEKGYELHIFQENDYQKKIIDKIEQSDRNRRARMLVEQAEEQEE